MHLLTSTLTVDMRIHLLISAVIVCIRYRCLRSRVLFSISIPRETNQHIHNVPCCGTITTVCLSCAGAFGMWFGPDAKNKHNSEQRTVPNQLAQDPAWCRRLYDDTFKAITEAQQAMAAALENLDAAFEAPVSCGLLWFCAII